MTEEYEEHGDAADHGDYLYEQRKDRILEEKWEAENELVAEYSRLARKASYHYADDSGGEWGIAGKAKSAAMALYWANPGLRVRFGDAHKGNLWSLPREIQICEERRSATKTSQK